MTLLPQKLEGKLGAPLFREEKEQSMPYITSVERRGKRQGWQTKIVESMKT
jgi:hypothetical protein